MAQVKTEEQPPIQVVVGANVYALRKAMDPPLSQEKLAAKAGVTKETIRVIESARDPERVANSLRLDTLDGIAQALRVATWQLLVWDAEATRVFLQSHPPLSVISGQGRGERSTVIPLLAPVRPT